MQTEKLSEYDLYLFHQGNLFYSYKTFGAHLCEREGVSGIRFAVWAPNAKAVHIVGDFNNWNGTNHSMHRLNESGVWWCFIPEIEEGTIYKYEIHSKHGGIILKSDPYAFYSELRPQTASIVTDLTNYNWGDETWQKKKKSKNLLNEPLLIYEVHLGSWKHKENGEFYTYRELAKTLIDYVKEMGYTHIEILPITEHPYDRSWGYQTTGFFSVTSRFGTPKDFMYFVDQCHQNGIGVLLDWVPSHFCKDDHGLRLFDGEPVYEYADERKAEKKGWGTLSFDFGRSEVISFLISNAFFWLDMFHIDGLRVDAVSSMLYLNFGREDEEKILNQYGGDENLEAIQFLRKLNESVFETFPSTYMMAEESSSWPLVSAPTYVGGLGFNYKWNMGWMNDMLRYMEMEPVHRKWHHQLITFSFFYAFSENFILPLSHDEVVHGKKSLLNKMPGDYWQKFANLRAFLGYMMAHPGKKLLFMGSEFGQFDEWKDLEDLDWELLEYPSHQNFSTYMKSLNQFYKSEKTLWELDHHSDGFEWIDPHDYEQSIVSFIRRGKEANDFVIVVCNFTPIVRYDYHIGVPNKGSYIEVFNSDRQEFGGSNQVLDEPLLSKEKTWHNQPYRLTIKVPPLAMLVLKLKDSEIERERGDDNET
ncbi:1,4-alpha-glucan branching protein GlgB [Alkalihalobacillus sp. BA299]|uniref:1,4-alpha-glucan branching protein GlgB n=1 Tax=Alkalihalobacillus sp. BA299 TaxID=2815938 RepID=UPI001ADD1F4B|nr:1,4-alpha-glucan branching protein GlgB [Alkalihalobacillus sp. BA299]